MFCFIIVFEVISSNTIERLASEEHWKRVKGFMWKYGGALLRLIMQSYTDKRTPSCSLVLSSLVSETGSSLYNIYFKNPTGYDDNQHFSKSLARECSSSDYGSALSGIGVGNGDVSPVALEGNVHTGASPPWLDATRGDNLGLSWKSESRSPVYPRAEKSKLNPKLVGAAWAERRKLELEMERRGEGNVLITTLMLIGSPILVEWGSLAQGKNLEKNSRWRVEQPRRLII